MRNLKVKIFKNKIFKFKTLRTKINQIIILNHLKYQLQQRKKEI